MPFRTLPTGSTLIVMALIGTTVVPYNLFLHASAVREKWPADVPMEQALRDAWTHAAPARLVQSLEEG